MHEMSRRVPFFLGIGLLAAIALAATPRAQEQKQQLMVTANPDGSCTVHRGSNFDIHIDNGATYERPPTKYYPARTYLCKDGRVTIVKP